MILVYDFARQQERIAQMQKVSLNRPDAGLSPNPLIGGPEWWAEIQNGLRPTHRLEGQIASVYWGSMADWAEFRMRTLDGDESAWTREGDCRRYVEGLGIRLAYVEHPWKAGTSMAAMGDASKIVLTIEVEDSRARSSSIAPGPGGAGYALARQRGDVVHYISFPTPDLAHRFEEKLEGKGLSMWISSGSTQGLSFVQVWHRDEAFIEPWRVALHELAAGSNGTYDGGEVVSGAVWGP